MELEEVVDGSLGDEECINDTILKVIEHHPFLSRAGTLLFVNVNVGFIYNGNSWDENKAKSYQVFEDFESSFAVMIVFCPNMLVSCRGVAGPELQC